jgi:hypothetical protein
MASALKYSTGGWIVIQGLILAWESMVMTPGRHGAADEQFLRTALVSVPLQY